MRVIMSTRMQMRLSFSVTAGAEAILQHLQYNESLLY